MDESTSALDPISTAKIEELVDTLKERYTVVIMTHNMLQALRVSDKTAFFLLGEMVDSTVGEAVPSTWAGRSPWLSSTLSMSKRNSSFIGSTLQGFKVVCKGF